MKPSVVSFVLGVWLARAALPLAVHARYIVLAISMFLSWKALVVIMIVWLCTMLGMFFIASLSYLQGWSLIKTFIASFAWMFLMMFIVGG